MPRYKLGIQVIFGELKGQGLRVASKSLWDPKFDNWASYTFTNESIYCTAIVFGIYFEWSFSLLSAWIYVGDLIH